MAISQSYGGFEGASFASWNNANMANPSGTYARSGSYGVRCNPSASSMGGTMVAEVSTTFSSGGMFATFGQFFMQVVTYPSANNTDIGGFQQNQNKIQMNTNGTWRINVAGLGITSGGSALPQNTWLRVVCKFWSYDSTLSEFGTSNVKVLIEIDDIASLTNYGSLAITGSNIGFTGFANQTMIGCLAPNTGTYDIWYDDAIAIVATGSDVYNVTKWLAGGSGTTHILNDSGSIFASSHIIPYLVSGQGAQDGFSPAGAYTRVDEIPMNTGGAADSVTSSTLNAATTYTKANASGSYSAEGFTVRANVRVASGSTTHAILIDSTEYLRALTTTTAGDDNLTKFASVTYFDPISSSVFTAIEMGVKNKDAAGNVALHNIFMEVLDAGIIEAETTLDATPAFEPEDVPPIDAETTLTIASATFSLRNKGTEINVPETWQLERFDIGPRREETS